MRATPITQKEAVAYIDTLHRHHIAARRDKYRVGCLDEKGQLCGVVQVGRPVARNLDDGKTLEVLRLCTDGTKNACSFLYSRAARIAKELGYTKIITYILETEMGDSLKAAGWHLEAENVGGGHGTGQQGQERTRLKQKVGISLNTQSVKSKGGLKISDAKL